MAEMATKLARHPQVWAIHASGVVAAMAPRFPTARSNPIMVANSLWENHWEKAFMAGMKTPPTPNPMRARPADAHPPAAVALSLSRTVIEPLDLEGTYYMPRVAVVHPEGPYDPHGLAGPVGKALSSANVVVIRGHGAFSWGGDLQEAFHWASALEHSCRILLMRGLDRS